MVLQWRSEQQIYYFQTAVNNLLKKRKKLSSGYFSSTWKLCPALWSTPGKFPPGMRKGFSLLSQSRAEAGRSLRGWRGPQSRWPCTCQVAWRLLPGPWWQWFFHRWGKRCPKGNTWRKRTSGDSTSLQRGQQRVDWRNMHFLHSLWPQKNVVQEHSEVTPVWITVKSGVGFVLNTSFFHPSLTRFQGAALFASVKLFVEIHCFYLRLQVFPLYSFNYLDKCFSVCGFFINHVLFLVRWFLHSINRTFKWGNNSSTVRW